MTLPLSNSNPNLKEMVLLNVEYLETASLSAVVPVTANHFYRSVL